MKDARVCTRQLFSKVLLNVAGVVFLATSANANLITNSSFEIGSFVDEGGSTMVLPVGSTAISGWTISNDQLAWIGAPNPWGLSAQDGTRFLDLTAYPAGAPFGGISQTFASVAGEQYELSFYLGSYTGRWGGPPVEITASAGGTSRAFAVTTTSSSSTWTPFTMLFTASAPTTTLTLTGTAGFQYIGLDNVSVEGLGGSNPGAVPEPGTYALMATGLLAAAAFRHRMKA